MIRKAVIHDLVQILEIIEDARSLFMASGSTQWQDKDGYPNQETFENDIQNGILYVDEVNHVITGVAAISHFEEITYRAIYEGNWLSRSNDYIVIHRLAVKKAFYHTGVAKRMMTFAETIARQKGLKSIRIDTHEKNVMMQQLLHHCGYSYCGIIYLLRKDVLESKRLAYEKIITPITKDIKAVIFDMDGTMIDSMGYWFKTGEEVFKSTFIASELDVYHELEHMSAWEIAFRLFDKNKDEKGKKAFIDQWIGLMEDYYLNKATLNVGLIEVLDYFKQKGIKLAVATGTNFVLAKPVLDRLGIATYFEFILTEDMVHKSKHHPDIYLLAAEKLEVNPQHCLVFEDVVHAARTAFNAGFLVVGVYDEASAKAAEKLKNYCHDFIDSYVEFLDKLGNQEII